MHPSAPASRSQGYPRLQILFHWLSVLLMASLALAGGLRDLLVSHTAIDMRSVMVVHIGCGMALLSLTLLRAATRLAGPALPPLAGSSRAQRVCAHAAHLAIYGFILGSCLLGWIIVNAKGLRIRCPCSASTFRAWSRQIRLWSSARCGCTNGWAGSSMACSPSTSPPPFGTMPC